MRLTLALAYVLAPTGPVTAPRMLIGARRPRACLYGRRGREPAMTGAVVAVQHHDRAGTAAPKPESFASLSDRGPEVEIGA